MGGFVQASPPLFAFLFASLVLAVTPGPGVVYIVTRTLSRGRTAGLASVFGVAFGNLCNAAAASVGLSVALAASSTAYVVVKTAGAAYLIWLGIRALRNGEMRESIEGRAEAVDGRQFRDGFVVALLNPKTALFFAAFLPQFIVPSSPVLAQTLALGATFVLIASVTDSAYVFAAAAVAPGLRGAGSTSPYVRIVLATTLIGLGICAAVAGSRRGVQVP